MAGPVTAAAAQLGGAKRVVLGHGHSDHRGSAAVLGAPVVCHPDEVADAEGDGGAHYMDLGVDHYDTRHNANRSKNNHIRQLEALGYTVTLQPAA